MTNTAKDHPKGANIEQRRTRVTDRPQFDDNQALAAVLDSLPEAVIVWEGDTVRYINSAVLALVRYAGSFEGFGGARFEKWIHPDDLPSLRDYRRDSLESNSSSESHTFRLMRTDGTACLVSGRQKNLWVSGRKMVVLSMHEVEKTDGDAVTDDPAEVMFQSVFRLAPEMMVMSSLIDGRIVDVNPAFLNLFGFSRDDVIGHSLGSVSIWADPTFYARFSQEFKMTASMSDLPTTLRTRGDISRHFRLFAQKVELGEEPILLLIGRDVTDDMVQAQELQRSRDSAELANRAKSEFLANMSHELRTPLNAILGFAEILRDEILGSVGQPRYKEYAADIHKSGTHLLSIINDILDLSKVESGRLESHLIWTDPIPALRMSLNLVQQRALTDKVALIFDETDGYEVEADDRMIKQIALNLLSNAVKFTEVGGSVTMSLTPTRDAGLCLTVEDTGIGMTPEEIKIAKRPFGQVDSSLARRSQGSGLGLPLVSAFAEKLDSTLRIVSTPGVGTKVSIFFPPQKVRVKEGERSEARSDDDLLI